MKYKIEDLLEKVIDNRGKTPPTGTTGHMLLEINSLTGDNKYPNYGAVQKIVSKETYNTWFRSGHPQIGDILIPTVGTLDALAYLNRDDCCIAQNVIAFRTKKEICDGNFLYYLLRDKRTRARLLNLNIGGVQPSIKVPHLKQLEVEIPDLETQKKIARILSALDQKIELNNSNNRVLYSLAESIFKERFKDKKYGDGTVGDYITPKRGKALLSKDTIKGPVPVVAGGLEAAAHHNKSNTSAPVITISASGANAGFVRLWGEKVWSSDSSFIDDSITKNVYFWYVLLKSRQKEIYDAQTGSAQAHIYPKHIADMSIGNISDEEISGYNSLVKPMFKKIALNDAMSKSLSMTRDSLLPKLMSGEIDINGMQLL